MVRRKSHACATLQKSRQVRFDPGGLIKLSVRTWPDAGGDELDADVSVTAM